MANNLNSVNIIGNLTKDCGANERDFGYTQGGLAIATINIAVNSGKKNADGTWGSEVSYFEVKIFGKTAENLKPYLTKGSKVAINGKLKQDRWQDKNTGNNMSKVYIIANEIELCGGKKDSVSTQEEVPPTAQEQSSYAKQYEQQEMDLQGTGSDFPEDIPF